MSPDLCALPSFGSLAASHDSTDVGLEPLFCGAPVTAAATAVATFVMYGQQAEPLEIAISPAAAAADAECAARQRSPMPLPLHRPSSASGPPPRPSSAHVARQRLPLSSIAFVTQARPRTAHPRASAPSQGSSEQARNGQTTQAQAVQAVLAKRSMSEGVLRTRPHQDKLLAGKYRTLHYLGRGTSASVWEAVDDTNGERFAVKVFDKNKGNWGSRQKQAAREARLLQSLTHSSIIKVHDTFDEPFKFHIVMELVVGGSLRELISQQPSPGLGEATSRDVFEQICEGIHFCHRHNIVHRDLKLENILLESATGSSKIIDFGFALQLRSAEQRLRVFCGTPSYMAPELVMGKEYSGFCTDVWALGVVLFGMLTGQLPFSGQTESQLYAKIRRGTFRFPDSVSELPRRVVAGILRIDAASRPTAAQALQHRWVSPGRQAVPESPPSNEDRTRPSSVPPCMRRLRTAY